MDIKELRIGNYISSGNKNLPEWRIYKTDLHIMTEEGCDTSIYKPIKLNEEWLLKFGFEYKYEVDDAFPFYYLDGFRCNEKFQPTDAGFKIANIEIKYVHQLQNLYFALTGKELEIKNT